jgi:hypothetical protein
MEVLFHCQVKIECGLLENDSDPSQGLGRFASHVVSKDFDEAGTIVIEPRHQRIERGLAGPVLAK